MIIFITGCDVIKDSNINTTNNQNTSSDKKESVEVEYLNIFKEAFPKAVIVDKAMFDVNNDKQDDLIVIFNNPVEDNKIAKSNICFIMKDAIKAIDIASGNLNFQFAYGEESLKTLENPNRISVMMHNTELNKIIDYQVTVTTNRELNETNIKIETIE